MGREWERGLRRRCSGPALSDGYHRETRRRHGVGGGWGPQEAPAVFTALLTAISAVNNPSSVATSGFITGALQLEDCVREGDLYVRFQSGIFHPFNLAAVPHCMQNEPCRSWQTQLKFLPGFCFSSVVSGFAGVLSCVCVCVCVCVRA